MPRIPRSLVFVVCAVALAVSAVAAAQPVTVRVAVGAVGAENRLHQEALDWFMVENPDIRVELVETPGGGERLALYLQYFEAQSQDLDVLQIDVIWPGMLEEHLVDLLQYGAGGAVDQHFPGAVANNMLDGRLVAIPYQIGAGMLYYRTDLLEGYGYDAPPRTWAELEEMARTIMDGERAAGNPDMWGYVFQGNAYEGLTCNAMEWFVSSGAGRIIEDDRTITVFNDAAIETLERAAGWIGTISPVGVTGFTEAESQNLFQSGNAVFLRNWPYAYGASNADGSAVQGLVAVTTLPSAEVGGPSASTLGGQTFGVSRYSANPEAAARVALHLASYEAQRLRAMEASFSGTIAALYDDPEVIERNPFFGQLADILMATVPRPSTITGERYQAVSRAYWTAVHDVLTGRQDAETSLALLELELESITGFPTGTP